jgi:hypothetical protein
VPGFAQPSVLLVAAPSPPEREWLGRCARLLRGKYARWVEPCAGAFAIPAVALREGWTVPQLECSDVSLFTSTLGVVCAGRHPRELRARMDGDELALPDDPVRAAAELIYVQLVLRMDEKPDVDYWGGIRRDLRERATAHRENIAGGIERLVDRFRGLSYRPMDLWDHIEQAKDDPSAIISLSPPTYLSGYEKFFDTGGRLEWQGPNYGLFDPSTHFKKIAAEAQGWNALLLMVEGSEGPPSGQPFYCRRGPGRDWSWYGWTNKPEVLESIGLTAIPRSMPDARPLDAPILPADHEITAASAIRVERIDAAAARWYKELWAHRLDPRGAQVNWAVIVDGHLAGVAGYTKSSDQRQANTLDPGSVLLTYGFGPPHPQRLPRLIATLALNLGLVRRFIPPWDSAGAETIVTAQLSRHPEAKMYRGVMKLKERKPDDQHGYRLIYTAPIVDRTLEEALAVWHKQEVKWQAKRSISATT